MLTIRWSTCFKRDVKTAQKRGMDMRKFKIIADHLVEENSLPTKFKDHRLTGNWGGHRECHLGPDWLLIYRIDEDQEILELVRMGSHADLFE